jgi:branched-chain amino acid transport system permease protein
MIADWFSNNESLIQSALVLAILGFSTQLALRAGVFSLAGVGCWAIGGYTAAILVQHGQPTLVAIGLGLVETAAVGLVLALILGRLRSLYLAMATFAFVFLVQIVARVADGLTGGPLGLYAIPVKVTTSGLLVATAVAAGVVVLFERGRSGRTLEALRLDEQLARTVGVNVMRHRVVAFVVSATLGSLSGAMNALLFNTMAPDQAGFRLVVDALTIVVIGGIGAWYGPLVGAAIVVWLPEILRFAGDWRTVAQGVIVVLMVIYAPEGVTGIVRRIRDLVAARRVPSRALDAAAAEKVPSL